MADCGNLTVEAAFDPSTVDVAGCSDTPGALEPGQQSAVGVIVNNGNDVSAEATVVVRADGAEIGRFTVTVPPGGQQYGVDITAPSSPGNYSLEANVEGGAQPATARTDGGTTLGETRRRCPTCG